MADANRLTNDIVYVWVTPTLEADYIRRGVFPHLRMNAAVRMHGNQALFELPREEARLVFEDAQTQRRVTRGTAMRGTTTAYGALENRLAYEFKEPTRIPAVPVNQERIEQARINQILRETRMLEYLGQACAANSARFGVGEKAYSGNSEEEVEILEDFGAYRVGGDSHFRLGYVARRASDGKQFFFSAGDLRTPDGKPTHLRLVTR